MTGPIGKVAAAVGAAQAVYKVAVQVEGRPIAARDQPAKVTVLGIEFFKRDENLNRTYLWGLIRRGKSAYAKKALAAKDKP